MVKKALSTKPIKIWLNGKVFCVQRLNHLKNSGKVVQESAETDVQSSIDSQEYSQLLEIVQENEKFTTNINLPSVYYSKMRNFPQFNLRKACEEIGTEILMKKDALSLSSTNIDSLYRAVSLTHSTIGAIRQQNMALQFTCIPCTSPNIQERFINLKKEILCMKSEIPGLHESIFICPLKLHVTIDVYSLFDENEMGEAIKSLYEYKDTMEKILLKTGPLQLDVGTLACMNENLKRTDVLYANVKLFNEQEKFNLQKIVDDIAEHFYHKGLARNPQDKVKLHMTIINTKYRKNEGRKRKWQKQSIDASKIIEKFKDYSFGRCDFNSIHLSQIHTKGDNGFYKPLAVIEFHNKVNL
ncbi:hypothetical protein ABEB36_007915 [Hypothenemus hampei]|uniref:A-kinase anchor protein 7-like phosphoesterase domain-containing protein n=1 Tax=Hypothenemus hampei TaxID=57062 RepID=A0ABD1EVJ3_HYPHA